jgi:rsbT co-antagonist protein RsbR
MGSVESTRSPLHDEVRELRARVAELEREAARNARDAEAMKRLIAILEETTDVVGSADMAGVAFYLNRSGRRLTGVDAEGDISFDLLEIHPAWARKIIQEEGIPAALRDGVWRGETAILTSDGRELPVSQVLVAHRAPDGAPTYLSTIMRDLSVERRFLEERQRFFSLSADMLCIADFEGYFRHLNPMWEQVLGYTPEELRAAPFMSFVHPDDVASTMAAAALLTEGQNVALFRNRYRCKDGSYRWLEWTSISVPDQGLIHAVARDATRRTQLETERRAAAARLRHLLEASPMTIYSRDASGDHPLTFVSESVTHFLGHTPEQILAKDGFVGLLHPEDAARLFAAPPDLDPPGSLLMHLQAGIEYRLRDARGDYRWIHDVGKLVRDETGQPVEIVGSWQDITERKRAEFLVERQAAALLALSTPIIPINNRVLVMPLVGVVDARRAQQVIDTLLEGVVSRGAQVAILDITGVSVVDSQVADALIRAAKAVKLVGAQVVLTGIRPEVAQTLVALSTDLGGIVTCGTLQAGIAYAAR